MNIEQLLKAAEYIERREREAEHGYASSLPIYNSAHSQDHSIIVNQPYTSNSNSKKTQGHRSTHNELEKSRRQFMRNCMDELKKCVPLGTDSCKHTTLGLLTKTKAFIKALEEKEKKQKLNKEELERRNKQLKSKVDRLIKVTKYRESRNERTISECEGSTVSSNSSTSYSSAASSHEDDVDVLGSDDDNSSNGSEGGVVVTTKKLSLVH